MIFSYFIIQNISAGSDFNIPIYIQTSAGIEKADYYDLVEILFNHDFEVQEKQEIVSDEKCSLRAEQGSLNVDGIIFDKSSLNFNIQLNSGQGSLTAQKNKNRFSLTFKVEEILETNPEKLVFRASGKATLNKKSLYFDDIIISFDKIDSLLEITGTGSKNFQATGLEVVFTLGCLSEEQNFYLLVDNGLLGKGRSAEEVVQILKQDSIFLDIYWDLEKLHKEKWWVHIPNGNPGSIWTTRNNCNNYEQKVNEYNIGENVYINGANFKPGEYEWVITGMPGEALCNPNKAVAIGTLTVDNSGAFCFNAYTIQADDCKKYKVDFSDKYDNYTVIPEFTPIIGILTALSAVGVFFFVRRR